MKGLKRWKHRKRLNKSTKLKWIRSLTSLTKDQVKRQVEKMLVVKGYEN